MSDDELWVLRDLADLVYLRGRGELSDKPVPLPLSPPPWSPCLPAMRSLPTSPGWYTMRWSLMYGQRENSDHMETTSLEQTWGCMQAEAKEVEMHPSLTLSRAWSRSPLGHLHHVDVGRYQLLRLGVVRLRDVGTGERDKEQNLRSSIAHRTCSEK